jgi:hypothetical protein
MCLDSFCQRVAPLLGKNARHELHYSSIGIQASELFAIRLSPASKDQPFGRHQKQGSTNVVKYPYYTF